MSMTNSQGSSSGSSNIPDYPQSPFLMSIANEANNYANQAYGRYDSTFQPLENSLISDSQKFQDPAYLATVGGQASAGAAQAGEAQRTNSLRDLQAFGIDPSSGRYAELDQSERGRTAATQAGASQTAMRATQQAGRDMRMQALNIGQQNLNRASHNLDTASNLKYPPLGHSNTQQNTSTSMPTPRSGNDSSGGSRGNQGSGNQGGDPFSRGSTDTGAGQGAGGAAMGQSPFGAGSGGGGGGPGEWGPGVGDPNSPNSLVPGYDPNQQNGLNPQSPGEGDPNYNSFQSDSTNPWGDGGAGGGPAPLDNSGYDPNANWGSTSGGGGGDSSSLDSQYASGGEINGQAGGAIPTDDSPSGGQQVDDVDIHANAGEFMIPKDVAAWKGQEFFQKLIETSRKARVTAPAHGTNNPAEAKQQGQMQNQAMGQ